MAEMSRRLAAVEGRVEGAMNRVHSTVDPIADEIEELGGLVRHLADTVASHAVALQQQGTVTAPPAPPPPVVAPAVTTSTLTLNESDTLGRRFRGLSREGVVDLIGKAVDANRIDLYLQPVVTLPQRKVRYYEALSRLRTPEGDIIPAADFIDYAESAGLMPKVDNLLLFRCVQVLRRLQLKNRDVGLFCNVSGSTLSDPVFFRQFLDFMEANRALAPALIFEFTPEAYRAFGPLEHEGMAALAERGFRFSMDHVADLRMEPRELSERSFRFLKAPAALLLNRICGQERHSSRRSRRPVGARRRRSHRRAVENESMVVDLLDYDVRFGQGFLFSPPRPVRVEALQGAANAAGEVAERTGRHRPSNANTSPGKGEIACRA